MQAVKDHPRLNNRNPGIRPDFPDAVQPFDRDHQTPIGIGPADQPGQARHRHHGHAVAGGDAQGFGHLGGIGGSRHGAGVRWVMLGPLMAVFRQIVACQHMVGPKGARQIGNQIGNQGHYRACRVVVTQCSANRPRSSSPPKLFKP